MQLNHKYVILQVQCVEYFEGLDSQRDQKEPGKGWFLVSCI